MGPKGRDGGDRIGHGVVMGIGYNQQLNANVNGAVTNRWYATIARSTGKNSKIVLLEQC